MPSDILEFVTSGSSSSKQGRWKLDVGWAAVIAALIGAAALVGVAFFAGTKTSSSGSTTTTSSKGSANPASVTIDPPSTGTIHWADNYSGDAVNLQPGQLVWTFNQTVTGDSISASVYPNSGPCNVDYSRHRWACNHIYVGTSGDKKKYRVCVAILSDSNALEVVNMLRTSEKKNSVWWFTTPPPYIHDNTPACMSVDRI
jgi:hypothetical protein